MRVLKKFIKIFIIIYAVIFIVLTNSSYGYTAAEVGAAIASYTEQYITSGNEQNILRYDVTRKYIYSHWDPEVTTSGDGLHYFCCATFVSCMYEKVAGLQIRSDSVSGVSSWASSYGSTVSSSEIQAGDILVRGTDHTALYIGNGKIGQASSAFYATNQQINIKDFNASSWTTIYRISEETAASVTNLDTTYSTATSRSSSSKNLSDFYFNGVPDGKYSVASTNIFEAIITTLADVADYLVGILTYGIRIVIVGCTALVDQLINNTADSLLGENIDAETGQDTGISSVEIDSANNENRLTIESLVFNEYDLLNVNIFKDSN